MDLRILLPKEHVLFDLPAQGERREMLRLLAAPLHASGAVSDLEAFLDAVERREGEMTTQMSGGTVFPHACSTSVQRLGLVVGMVPEPGFCYDPDASELARVFFLISIPAASPSIHLPLLTHLAMFVTTRGKLEKLLESDSPAVVHRQLLAWIGK